MARGVATTDQSTGRSYRGFAFAIAVGLGGFAGLLLAPGWLQQRSASTKPVQEAPPIPLASADAAEPPMVAVPGVDAWNSEGPLSLVLFETFPGRNAQDGAAKIGTAPAAALTVGAGGLLPNGARLREVYADRVVISDDRGRAVLYIKGEKPAQFVEGERKSGRLYEVGSLVRVGGEKKRSELSAPAPSAWSLAILAQPVYGNGQLRGIQLDPGQSPQRFRSLGFEAGDILMSMDGMRVDSPSFGEFLIGAIDSGAPVTVSVERQGRLEYLTIDAASSGRRDAAVGAPPGPVRAPLPPPVAGAVP